MVVRRHHSSCLGYSFLSVVLVGLVTVPASAAEWAVDKKTKCKVQPIWTGEGVTVSWTGGCKSGIASGKGKLTWSLNGETLIVEDGTLKNGMLEGQGSRRFLKKNSVYRGGFKAGRAHGKGKLDAPGADYEGDWVDNEMQGQGRFKFANGNVYVGGIANGRKAGLGRMTWSDGSSFEGSFINDDAEGKGTCKKGGHIGPCVFSRGTFVKWQ